MDTESQTTQTNNIVRVAVADDHNVLRKGLIMILEMFPNIKVVAEGADGAELIAKLEALTDKPDICLLDISMPPGMDGYQALKLIKGKWPAIHVMMLTQHYQEFTIIRTLMDGAASCLPKETSPEVLHTAINQVLKHGFYHSDTDTRYLTQSSLDRHKKVRLSENELTYLKYACTSMTHREIARQMGMSDRTIDSYRDALCDKLDLKNRVELVVFALQTGLVQS